MSKISEKTCLYVEYVRGLWHNRNADGGMHSKLEAKRVAAYNNYLTAYNVHKKDAG